MEKGFIFLIVELLKCSNISYIYILIASTFLATSCWLGCVIEINLSFVKLLIYMRDMGLVLGTGEKHIKMF